MKKGLLLVLTLMFLLVMVSCSSSKKGENQGEGLETSMTIDEIWKIEDVNSFLIAMLEHIEEKCEYGDNMGNLSEPERIFYITQACEVEVNNGGFSQFFFNSSGDFSGELEYAFTEIGAIKTAEICHTALNAFGRELPTDTEERRKLLDDLKNDKIDSVLNECDNRFYEYEEDLNSLNYGYIIENRAAFS